MADGAFGETYVGGDPPERWRHVFATVQSLARRPRTTSPPDHFDVVVIDEFHHAEAPTYRRLLDHLQPKELLGLTATPERADGETSPSGSAGGLPRTSPVGRPRADLLCPSTTSGSTTTSTCHPLSGSAADTTSPASTSSTPGTTSRAAKVLRDCATSHRRRQMRALGFCVPSPTPIHGRGVQRDRHPSVCGLWRDPIKTSGPQRSAGCAAGEVNCLFAADLFNEGLDLPTSTPSCSCARPRARPSSSSSSVAAYACGREGLPDGAGLHRSSAQGVPIRTCATGRSRGRRSRLSFGGASRRASPSFRRACHLELDRVARDVALENLRRSIGGPWKELADELREMGDVSLTQDPSGEAIASSTRSIDPTGGGATFASGRGAGGGRPRRRRPCPRPRVRPHAPHR